MAQLYRLLVSDRKLQKRSFSTGTKVIVTTLDQATLPTSVTLLGVYEPETIYSGESAVLSTFFDPTATTYALQTSPLTAPSTLNPSCSTAFAAYEYILDYVLDSEPMFWVGSTSGCLPTGYQTVTYYSPAICPSGYTLAHQTLLATSSVVETAGICCYESYTLDAFQSCVSHFNPDAPTSGVVSPTTTIPISDWTVTAEYVSEGTAMATFGTSVFDGSSVLSAAETSYVLEPPTTIFTIISGNGQATLIAPQIPIRWKSTDQVVMNWLARQSAVGSSLTNGTIHSTQARHHGISPGIIAGIAVGAVVGLGLIVGAFVLFLKKRKERLMKTEPSYPDTTDQKVIPSDSSSLSYLAPLVQKPELDSRALSRTEYTIQTVNHPLLAAESQPVSSPRLRSELPAHSRSQSSATSTLHSRSRSSTEWVGQRQHQDSSPKILRSEMQGLLMRPATPQDNAAWLESQQAKIKEEKARLQRLQELSEMEIRLEERLRSEIGRGQ